MKAKNLRNWHNLHTAPSTSKFIHIAAESTNQRRRGVYLQYGQRLLSSTQVILVTIILKKGMDSIQVQRQIIKILRCLGNRFRVIVLQWHRFWKIFACLSKQLVSCNYCNYQAK